MKLIIVILITIGYAELVWYLIKIKKRPYEEINSFVKFMVGFNFVIAILFSSYGSLCFGIILSLYQLVIYKERVKQLQ